MSDATPQNELVKVIARLVDDGGDGTIKIRTTNDRPKKASVIDYIMFITKLSRNDSGKYLRRICESNPDIRTKMSENNFGRGRPTFVADACTLIEIHGLLPKAYTESFRQQRDALFVRYVGGDTSLADEVHEIREIQNETATTAPNHPMRVFGEAVETGQVGSMTQNSIEEQQVARAKSITHYHEQKNAMKSNGIINNKDAYLFTNSEISRAALGKYPCRLREELGLDSDSKFRSRNYMNAPQLLSVAWCESIAKELANGSDNLKEYKDDIKRMTDMAYEMNRMFNVHGNKNVPSIQSASQSSQPTKYITNNISHSNVTINN